MKQVGVKADIICLQMFHGCVTLFYYFVINLILSKVYSHISLKYLFFATATTIIYYAEIATDFPLENNFSYNFPTKLLAFIDARYNKYNEVVITEYNCERV